MRARCTSCNDVIEFRNQRGNKLSARKCKCGGSFQIMSWADVPANAPPTNSNHYGNYLKNRAGEVFFYDRETRKAIPLRKPTTHDYRASQKTY